MSDEQNTVGGRRRSRGAAASERSEALERLKARRQGGRRSESGYQIKVEDPIYDMVDEAEYDALVSKRREENRGFIVDDDGLGYGDLGEEEDWNQSGFNLSSDESDRESERPKKKKAERKEPPAKKPSPLTAAAALMGKQRLSSLFTSSVFKKNRDDKSKVLSCDSLIDDVIAESAPDEADRERWRRGQLGTFSNSKGLGSNPNVKTENASLGSFDSISKVIKASSSGDSLLNFTQNSSLNEEKGLPVESKVGSEGLNSEMGAPPVSPVQNSSANGSGVKERFLDVAETKPEPVVKTEELNALNAKINVEKEDPAMSATAGWLAARGGGKVDCGSVGGGVVNSFNNSEDKSEFEVQPDGSLQFYMLDAYEEIYGANMGTIYLFGKVKEKNTFPSCCIIVKNMQRCVYAVPNSSVFANEAIFKLEKDFQQSQISSAVFRANLQEAASGLKNEIAKHLLDLNVSSYCMAPVKRNYAFERLDVPVGENYVLKINYPFKDPPLPPDLRGGTFSALLGTNSSALELFLIKRKIKGPSWLSISNFSSCPDPQRVSWCKYEVTVDCPKEIRVSTSKEAVDTPPVVVTAISLKTIVSEKQNLNEIVSASIICCHRAKIHTPMLASEWKQPGMLSHFTVVRKLEGGIFPMGFTKEATDKNSKADLNILAFESSERALLNRLMIELKSLDSDILVGHNISGFDLDILLNRAQACRVPSRTWSKIGRLRRSTMPNLTKGGMIFGSGASPGIMLCIAGRLVCDTYLSSRDLLKEVSYSLTELAKSQLNKSRKELLPSDIPKMFQTSDSLMELVEYGETDAWLSLELMFHLSILPLTRQLTNISGNLWGKTLQGARAQRVEYLLLHAFYAKKYIVPDKAFRGRAAKFEKRKLDKGLEVGYADMDDVKENDNQQNDHGRSKKGPAYSGGLVLDPKRGLYDKFVLLLDFNSLYPSIIQEYNICFTTVERSPDGPVPRLPSNTTPGVLPELLKHLVERRKLAKNRLKAASGLQAQQFDIQQQALKLTANSMYGCLGFSNSRFYAKPLAELITMHGREILQSTVDLVQNNLNLEVIYGDTDSIMIYSGIDDIAQVKAIARKVIEEVNKRYKSLQIDLDGLYKRMLLLKKKKYAAVKVLFKDGTPYEVIERKGLDMVRRDWSSLSKEIGDFCLGQILSGGSCEDVVESIHNSLMKVQEDMRNGEVSLEKYIITKSLTKPPEAYPDKNQPHVQVALRLKQSGLSTGCCVGDTVPYIICCEQGSTGSSGGIAQRARHPDELKRDSGKWMIDIDYYLSQQIHPVVSRLCASIQGTSPPRLADCLGLDSSKFQSKTSEINEPSSAILSGVDDGERYKGCEPLTLSCPSCASRFDCPPIFTCLCSSFKEKPIPLQAEESIQSFWHKLRCLKCPGEGDLGRISPSVIANQVKRQVDGFISVYYKGLMMCDDDSCNYTTRSLNLRVIGDSERGTVCPNYPRCNGRLVRKYTEADLYKQLTYFCHVLDTVRCIEKVEVSTRIPLERDLARIRPVVELAVSAVQEIRDRSAYSWVRLKDIVSIL